MVLHRIKTGDCPECITVAVLPSFCASSRQTTDGVHCLHKRVLLCLTKVMGLGNWGTEVCRCFPSDDRLLDGKAASLCGAEA